MTPWRWAGRAGLRLPLLLGAWAFVPASVAAQQPGWMAGCWERRTATGVGREEWRATERGLDGGAAVFRGDTLVAWEFLRVDAAGYHAAPNRQAAHRFAAVAVTADSAVWADPAHDFPQRIAYRPVGRDSLLATVEATRNGQRQGQQLRFARVACDARRDLTTAVALRDTLRAMLDSIHALGRAPGISAAVALPDGRTIAVATGVADSTGMVPLHSAHRFLAGSVGKTFFAALALDLVASGRLDLDTKISQWLGSEPWFSRLPNGADITVRQLMNHTSGLVRYEFQPEFVRDVAADPLRVWKVHEQLAYVFDRPPPFAAGAGWEYSDTNYLVLAMILERVLAGPSAYEAIRSRFLMPLRLAATTPSDSPRLPGLANGYGGTPDPLGMSGPMLRNGTLRMNPAFEWAGGGYVSTPEDLARWAQAWYDGRAVAPAPLRQALEAIPARALGAGARYGLGVIVRDTPRGVSYGHSGFFPGYLTEMRYYPDARIGVAVQTNTSDQRALGRGLAGIAHALAERAMLSR